MGNIFCCHDRKNNETTTDEKDDEKDHGKDDDHKIYQEHNFIIIDEKYMNEHGTKYTIL